jgi:predicted nucleic acid-binding protein
VLADTSPLYSALDPSDDNHDRVREDIERLNAEGIGIMVAYPTLCECYSVILYKLGSASWEAVRRTAG